MTRRRAVTTRLIRRRGCRRARFPRPQSRPGSAGRSNADRLSLTNRALSVVPRETATQKEAGDGELRAPTRLVVLVQGEARARKVPGKARASDDERAPRPLGADARSPMNATAEAAASR